MDFITIVFNHELEIQLLKLQAFSFQFVDPELINRIVVVFNDKKELNDTFSVKFENTLSYYPANLKNKVKLLFLKDIGLDFPDSNWRTQQVVKIQVAKIVKTKYYIVLDTKNHFIKHINHNFFFNSERKPYMYFDDAGDIFGTFYNNCLSYFNTTCPNKSLNIGNLRIQTITPFLFITQECLNLIKHVEQRENRPFHTFFVDTTLYTEFYFYYSYLVHSNKHVLYENNLVHVPFVTLGPQDPKTNYYNTWDYKKHVIDTQDIRVFSFHRHSLYILDNEYKKNLLDFYNKTYQNEDIIKKIMYFLLA
jgi:hypothetical protein